MMRKEWDYEQLKKFGSHAGQPGTARWCEVEHRVIDWAVPLPFTGEFEVVIMIEGCDRRDAWVGLSF